MRPSAFSISCCYLGAATTLRLVSRVDTVRGRASVGFDGAFDHADACAWWSHRLAEIEAGRVLLLMAREPGGGVASGQLVLARYPNGRHRAEVAKLLVHSSHRRRGLGAALMAALEAAALAGGRTLLLLDTETGSDAERFMNAWAGRGSGWCRTTTTARTAAAGRQPSSTRSSAREQRLVSRCRGRRVGAGGRRACHPRPRASSPPRGPCDGGGGRAGPGWVARWRRRPPSA
jgi:GNAT superfamily N-acetyltransferase